MVHTPLLRVAPLGNRRVNVPAFGDVQHIRASKHATSKQVALPFVVAPAKLVSQLACSRI